jgi:arylsulfatase A-like enzyme
VLEGGIRVPGFVNWPQRLAAGTIEAPVHIVDWMPTLCHLAGVQTEPSPPWDGQNIWPIITGEESRISERSMYWKTRKASAVRKGDWKLIISGKEGKNELFNLQNDPYEKSDLASQESERVLELKALLEQIASKDREPSQEVQHVL